MTEPTQSVEVLTPETVQAVGQIEKSKLDQAISTAKAYPRAVKRNIDKAIEYATLDVETATSCFYRIPKAGKIIKGESVRCAEIVASTWGNISFGSRILGHDGKKVKAQAFCHDLESNVMVTIEQDRKITGSNGKTFSEDMIHTTGLACAAIARREAIFNAIPKAIVKKVAAQATRLLEGEIKNMPERRKHLISLYKEIGVSEKQVLARVEKEHRDELSITHLIDLHGMYTAIKENEITKEEVFKAAPPTANKPKIGNEDEVKKPPKEAPPPAREEPEPEPEEEPLTPEEEQSLIEEKAKLKAKIKDLKKTKGITFEKVMKKLDLDPDMDIGACDDIAALRAIFEGVKVK